MMTGVRKKSARARVSTVFCVIFTSTSVSSSVCERGAGVSKTQRRTQDGFKEHCVVLVIILNYSCKNTRMRHKAHFQSEDSYPVRYQTQK